MLSKYKSVFEKYNTLLARPFYHVHPNILTTLASVSSLLFFVCMIMKLYLLAIVFFGGNIFDMIDGIVARATKRVTSFGGFLDSTLDRCADFFIISAFAYAGIVRWQLIIPLLCTTFLISYIRSRAELATKGSTTFSHGLVERPERIISIGIALICYLLVPQALFLTMNSAEIIFCILLVASVYTVIQRGHIVYKQLH